MLGNFYYCNVNAFLSIFENSCIKRFTKEKNPCKETLQRSLKKMFFALCRNLLPENPMQAMTID